MIVDLVVLQARTVRGVDPAIVATLWLLIAALGLTVGHYLGRRYASGGG